jgi:hypothetical protein
MWMQNRARQFDWFIGLPLRWVVLAGAIVCAIVVASPQAWAQSGLMRQLGTLRGDVPEYSQWDALTMPQSVADRPLLAAGYETEDVPYQLQGSPPGNALTPGANGAPLEAPWPGGYPGGPQFEDEFDGGWCNFIPRGCWPWGERTPDHARHKHIFFPLEGTSWRNRPLSAGWAVGGFWGDDPKDNLVSYDPGIYGAYRVGWDYDHYFGLEARLAQATPGISTKTDVPSTTADVTLFDVSMLWYPTGDSRLRPYFLAGLGFQYHNFRDHNYRLTEDAVFSMPLGIGVKWMCSPWLALRMEFTENIAVGSPELDMMHNLSLNGGVEVRFGGTRPSYWPYNSSKYLW